jgi:hypothetical protein
MRFKVFTFVHEGLLKSGRNIELYYGIYKPTDYQEMMSKPKESIGNTGAFVTVIDHNTPVIVAPESSYMFNYDFMQLMSPVRNLTRVVPEARSLIYQFDNDLYHAADDAYDRLTKKDK